MNKEEQAFFDRYVDIKKQNEYRKDNPVYCGKRFASKKVTKTYYYVYATGPEKGSYVLNKDGSYLKTVVNEVIPVKFVEDSIFRSEPLYARDKKHYATSSSIKGQKRTDRSKGMKFHKEQVLTQDDIDACEGKLAKRVAHSTNEQGEARRYGVDVKQRSRKSHSWKNNKVKRQYIKTWK